MPRIYVNQCGCRFDIVDKSDDKNNETVYVVSKNHQRIDPIVKTYVLPERGSAQMLSQDPKDDFRYIYQDRPNSNEPGKWYRENEPVEDRTKSLCLDFK